MKILALLAAGALLAMTVESASAAAPMLINLALQPAV